LVLYIIAILLGIYVTLNSSIPLTETVREPEEVGLLFLGILITAVALLYLSRFFSIRYFLYFVEAAVFLIAGSFVFAVFVGDRLGFLLSLGVLIIRFLKPWPWKNVVALISSVGAGVLLGFSMSFPMALLLAAFLVVYDFFAVFVSRHMIVLAQEVLKANASFTITAGKPIRKRPGRRIGMRADVGTGDIVVPLMLVSSGYLWGLNPWVLGMGAILGFAFTMFLLERFRIPLPALPPILSVMALVYLGDMFLMGLAK
jgi:presenilin-like A22 family membrane protease